MNEFAQWHRRNELVGAELHLLAFARPPVDGFNTAAAMANALDVDAFDRLAVSRRQDISAALPHHPRTQTRVMELVNQRGDNLAVLRLSGAGERVSHRFTERQIPDSLRGPIR